jgi:succinate dehydrogenase / fumarate reductase cytochrome b subunit
MRPTISSEFIWRRVHSLMGFWLVIYLIEHLLINSQAALWLDDRGSTFIRMVNSLESLPYLHVIEVLLIGVPIAIHGAWGVRRALQAKTNTASLHQNKPTLKFSRNIAFSWQRLTSWILLFGIIGHVAQMRFLERPKEIVIGSEKAYVLTVAHDPKLEALAERFGATVERTTPEQTQLTTPSPGVGFLFMVRDTFKNPVYCVLYTLFVLAAAFHAFNGFWTFLITWGFLLSYSSQQKSRYLAFIGMLIVSFFGLAAIWN